MNNANVFTDSRKKSKLPNDSFPILNKKKREKKNIFDIESDEEPLLKMTHLGREIDDQDDFKE